MGRRWAFCRAERGLLRGRCAPAFLSDRVCCQQQEAALVWSLTPHSDTTRASDFSQQVPGGRVSALLSAGPRVGARRAA